MKPSFAVALGASLGLVQCLSPHHISNSIMLKMKGHALAPDVDVGAGNFTQNIDHRNPSVGTFQQRFWYSTTYWGGPGYPVVFYNLGEMGISDEMPRAVFAENTLASQMANSTKAALVLLEHRYFGESMPFPLGNLKGLQYHTLDNAVADLVHFAREAALLFDGSGASNAPNSPWILVGCSYAGALAAWTAKLAPGTMWAYAASSAPVMAIDDFWEYYVPIEAGMPKNCSSKVAKIIAHVDEILLSGNRSAVDDLKAKFGLQALVPDDDFAAALIMPIGEWQDTGRGTEYGNFYQMCDALNGYGIPLDPAEDATVPLDESTSVELLVEIFGRFAFDVHIQPWCGLRYATPQGQDQSSIACFDTYNPTSPYYTDLTSEFPNKMRSWWWMLCDEPFGWWQGSPISPSSLAMGGPDQRRPAIVSSLVTKQYWSRQCNIFFPPEEISDFGAGETKAVEYLNLKTGGWDWNNSTERVIFVNGLIWRPASVSSETRPLGPILSSKMAPVFLIPNATHCEDQVTVDNAGVIEVIAAQVAQMVEWVEEFWSVHGKPPEGPEAP